MLVLPFFSPTLSCVCFCVVFGFWSFVFVLFVLCFVVVVLFLFLLVCFVVFVALFCCLLLSLVVFLYFFVVIFCYRQAMVHVNYDSVQPCLFLSLAIVRNRIFLLCAASRVASQGSFSPFVMQCHRQQFSVLQNSF